MTAAIQPFDFSGQQVRVVTDETDEPWFVAADVARILGYSVAKDMTRHLDDDEKGGHLVPTLGGEQDMTVITEAGLYSAILQRQVGRIDDEARRAVIARFKRWVTHEVLPAIRRTGAYVAPQTDADRALTLAHQVIALHQRNTELEPKAAVADALMAADGDYSLREAAQILCRDHGIDTGQNRLLGHLRALGWVDRNGLPYQSQIQTGRVAVRTRTYDHPHTGEPQISNQLRVTPKGLAWLHTNWPRPTALTAIAGGAA